MQYDPIKRSLGAFFNKSPFMRRLFYKLLDLLLLRAWHVHKELKIWAKDKKDSVRILDAGAGFGQYTSYLSGMNKHWNILAVDVKEEQVADCNEFFSNTARQNVHFVVADLSSFVEEDAFDLVLCVDVMEHIEEDAKVFENYHTSMKKGAMLLVSTPSDQGGSDVHGHDDSSFIEEHVRDGYHIFDIEEKLKSAGFSKVEARYSYGAPGKVSWQLSMKFPILLLGISKLFFIILPFYYLLFFPFCLALNWLDSRMKHKTGTGLIVKAWK